MNEDDATENTKLLKLTGLHLPLTSSAPRLTLDLTGEDNEADLSQVDESEKASCDKPPAPAAPAELPSAVVTGRNRSQEEKAVEITNLVNSVDVELQGLPDVPGAGQRDAPVPAAPVPAAPAPVKHKAVKPKEAAKRNGNVPPPTKPTKPKRKSKPKSQDSSDEEDSEGNSEDDDEDEDEEEFVLDKIVAAKGSGKGRRYQIKWLDYDEMTWEPLLNLSKQDVAAYEASFPPAPVCMHTYIRSYSRTHLVASLRDHKCYHVHAGEGQTAGKG